jgi:hypothetical protein
VFCLCFVCVLFFICFYLCFVCVLFVFCFLFVFICVLFVFCLCFVCVLFVFCLCFVCVLFVFCLCFVIRYFFFPHNLPNTNIHSHQQHLMIMNGKRSLHLILVGRISLLKSKMKLIHTQTHAPPNKFWMRNTTQYKEEEAHTTTSTSTGLLSPLLSHQDRPFWWRTSF